MKTILIAAIVLLTSVCVFSQAESSPENWTLSELESAVNPSGSEGDGDYVTALCVGGSIYYVNWGVGPNGFYAIVTPETNGDDCADLGHVWIIFGASEDTTQGSSEHIASTISVINDLVSTVSESVSDFHTEGVTEEVRQELLTFLSVEIPQDVIDNSDYIVCNIVCHNGFAYYVELSTSQGGQTGLYIVEIEQLGVCDSPGVLGIH